MIRHLIHSSLIVLIVVLVRQSDLHQSLSYDENIHAYIGGVAPSFHYLLYKDVFDHKPPLIYLPFWLADQLFGHGWQYIRLMGLVYSILVSLVIYWFGRRLFGGFLASFWVLLENIVSSNPSVEGQYTLIAENQLKLPLILALSILPQFMRKPSSKTNIVFGLILSWLTLIKQTFILLPIFLVIYSILTRRKFLVFFIAFLFPWISLATYYYYRQSLSEFWFAVFEYNQKYYLSDSHLLNSLHGFFIRLSSLLFWFVPILISVTAAVRLIHKFKYIHIYIGLMLIFIIAMISTLIPGDRLYGHYLILFQFIGIVLIIIGLSIIKRLKILSVLLMFTLLIYSTSQHLGRSPAMSQPSLTMSPSQLSQTLFLDHYVGYYYDYRLPITLGNQIITDLPFQPNHDYFLRTFSLQFKSSPPDYIIATKDNPTLIHPEFIRLTSTYQKLLVNSETYIYYY